MTSMRETLASASNKVEEASNHATNESMRLARWMLSYRTNMRKLDGTLNRAVEADASKKHPVFVTRVVIDQIEEFIDELEASICGPLAGAISAIDACLEFVEEKAAADCHPISDPKVRAQVFNLTEGKCAYCDVTLVNGGGDAEQFCVEHVVPVSKGGPNNIVNYVPSCRSCNNSKKDGHVLLFIKRNLPRRQETAPTAEVIPIMQRSW